MYDFRRDGKICIYDYEKLTYDIIVLSNLCHVVLMFIKIQLFTEVLLSFLYIVSNITGNGRTEK